MTAHWQWHMLQIISIGNLPTAGGVTRVLTLPPGHSLQRVITFGSMWQYNVDPEGVGYNSEVPVPMQWSWTVYTRLSNTDPVEILHQDVAPADIQRFVGSRTAPTGSNPRSCTWAPRGEFFQFDAQARMAQDSGTAQIGGIVHWQETGTTGSGHYTPTSEPSGTVWMRILTSY